MKAIVVVWKYNEVVVVAIEHLWEHFIENDVLIMEKSLC